MESLRKWFYKPKRDDSSLLAQFFHADEDLNMVTAELDSFDGRKDPERCTSLVNHLRQCQDKVLTICSEIMNELIAGERASRDFRVKFPDDVMQENLAGQLWFGAECLAAGSSIMNKESESAAMRPLAKALIKALENVRFLLREQCFRASANLQVNPLFTDKLLEALKIFDRLFAEFELRYVSAMVPVKSVREYFLQQMVVVLFSETLQRALRSDLLTQDMVDDYDPALMFTIPRLAIVSGLLFYTSGPICLDKTPADMSEMFRPFRLLLMKIRKLLLTLSKRELWNLERLLCSCEEPAGIEWNCVDDGADGHDTSSESSMDNDAYPHHAATPPPTPQGYLNQNRISSNSHGAPACDGPVITAHSLPDVDHTVSINIVTEALSSLLANQPTSTDSGFNDNDREKPEPTSSTAVEDGCKTEDTWSTQNRVAGSWGPSPEEGPSWGIKAPEESSSCEISPRFLPSTEQAKYRIRTSTRTTIQEFEKSAPPAERRKRRKLVKTRSASAMRVSVTLQMPSQSKRLSRCSSRSSSCSSCVSSDTCSLSEDSSLTEVSTQQEIDIQQARAPFSSSEDLLHRLFVCIAGVADQLQSNFAGDLRNILKCVFQMNASQSEPEVEASTSPTSSADSSRVESAEEAWETTRDVDADVSPDSGSVAEDTRDPGLERPPPWVPDFMAPHCSTCGAVFTLVRRRHHCRNCGEVFCSRCSSNSVPLPKYGHLKPVRVCNRCFLCHVTPFTIDQVASFT